MRIQSRRTFSIDAFSRIKAGYLHSNCIKPHHCELQVSGGNPDEETGGSVGDTIAWEIHSSISRGIHPLKEKHFRV